jgi:protein phosphatase
VGTESAIEADVFAVTAEPGDLYLLCSDGLTDMLGADDIAATILAADRDPGAAGEALVAAANAEGGEDNITVVLFELVEGDPEDVPEHEPTDSAGPDAIPLEEPSAATTTPQDVRTHGAGPGGRLAAIGIIALVLIVGVLVLYWGIKR